MNVYTYQWTLIRILCERTTARHVTWKMTSSPSDRRDAGMRAWETNDGPLHWRVMTNGHGAWRVEAKDTFGRCAIALGSSHRRWDQLLIWMVRRDLTAALSLDPTGVPFSIHLGG